MEGHALDSSGNVRTFSYESLNGMLLKASLSESWKRNDWPGVRHILLGWSLQYVLLFGMLFSFLLYGCELLEPTDANDDPALPTAGRSEEFIFAWLLSAMQRFVLHEPTLILASKALPVLFSSAFFTNCCGG